MSDPSESTRWSMVERLFSAAQELPVEDRPGFVEKECDGDPELRAELLALLESSEASEEYLLDLAARAGAHSRRRDELGRLAGKRLGAWRLVELIGRGGMGIVYLTERDDDQFRMTAALKILPLGMSSEAQRRKFLSERQILARLNHPNIARILDGGVTEDATPFYVMEFVEGTPIDAYCDQHRLSVDERIELFEGVCRAVEHAHSNLIVHQDLKPGNILVTGEGEVKLLDFGIARILEGDQVDRGDPTGLPGRAMTLSYASPEQVRGEPVSTATDVYSLGLILYELLAGRHPYRHEITGPGQGIAVITDTIPRPPSGVATDPTSAGDVPGSVDPPPEALAARRGTTPPRLKRALAGDLDTIILMALRKEPERRYASVSDFLADLRNARLKRPVGARPDSLSYRASRFLLRNRVAASMSAVALVLLLGLVVISVRSAAKERTQSELVRREASRAEAVTDFLVGLFEFTEAPDGLADTIRARTLVDRGATRILESLDDQPETKTQILGALAQVYGHLGLHDKEVALLEQGVEILRAGSPPDPRELAAYIRRLAGAHAAGRDYPKADSLFPEALELFRRNPPEPRALAGLLLGYAANDAALGKIESALAMNAEATVIFQEEAGDEALATLRSLSDRGMIFRAAEEPDSAAALYEKILPTLRRKGDSGRYLLSTTLNNLGYLRRTQGDLPQANALYREALPIERELKLPVRFLTILSNIASVEESLGNIEEVERLLLERVEFARDTWPGGHWRVGGAEGSLAQFYLTFNRPGEALPYARNQLESFRVQIAEEHAWTTEARVVLGLCLLELDRFQEAEPYFLRAYDAFVTSGGMEHPQTQQLVGRIVTMYRRWGRSEEEARFRRFLLPPEEGGGGSG